MAQMTFQMKKAILTSDPEIVPLKSGTNMVKVTVMNQKFRKEGDNWVENGEEHYDLVGFGDIATEFGMYGSGEELDIDGVIERKKYVNKYKKEVTSTNFIIKKFNVSEEN